MISLFNGRFTYSGPYLDEWRPILGRGGDEWCNPSVYVVVPFLGTFNVFYSRTLDRSQWWFSGAARSVDGSWTTHYVSPDYQSIAYIENDHDVTDDPCPHTKSSEWIFANASVIEPLDDDSAE